LFYFRSACCKPSHLAIHSHTTQVTHHWNKPPPPKMNQVPHSPSSTPTYSLYPTPTAPPRVSICLRRSHSFSPFSSVSSQLSLVTIFLVSCLVSPNSFLMYLVSSIHLSYSARSSRGGGVRTTSKATTKDRYRFGFWMLCWIFVVVPKPSQHSPTLPQASRSVPFPTDSSNVSTPGVRS
jgi:hypothetical protein